MYSDPRSRWRWPRAHCCSAIRRRFCTKPRTHRPWILRSTIAGNCPQHLSASGPLRTCRQKLRWSDRIATPPALCPGHSGPRTERTRSHLRWIGKRRRPARCHRLFASHPSRSTSRRRRLTRTPQASSGPRTQSSTASRCTATALAGRRESPVDVRRSKLEMVQALQ